MVSNRATHYIFEAKGRLRKWVKALLEESQSSLYKIYYKQFLRKYFTAERSILDIWQGFENASASLSLVKTRPCASQLNYEKYLQKLALNFGWINLFHGLYHDKIVSKNSWNYYNQSGLMRSKNREKFKFPCYLVQNFWNFLFFRYNMLMTEVPIIQTPVHWFDL